MASVAEIVDQIKGLNILEVSELVKELETAFGVTAAAPMAFAAAPAAGAAAPAAGGGEAAPVAEAKTEFDVILTDIGPNKINVIKAVRELTNLGLKEAKDLVEAAPKPVKEGVNKEEADAAQKKLVEAGAKADVK